MSLKCPFEAVGVQEFPVAPITQGEEYTVINVTINSSGARYQIELPDGTTGWFPAKYVEVIDTSSQFARAQTTKQQAEERRQALREKFAETTKQRVMKPQDEVFVDDGEVDDVAQSLTNTQISPPKRVPRSVDTFATTKGFLANAPGFNTNLDSMTFSDDNVDINADHYPVQKQAQPQPTPAPVAEAPPPTKSGLYKTVTPKEETHFTPSADLPAQYQTNSVQKWLCGSCGMENGLSSAKCGMCGNDKPAVVSTVSYEKSPGGTWKCVKCTVENKTSSLTCSMCGAKWEPTRTVTNVSASAYGAATSTTSPKKGAPGGKPKRKIVGKNESGVELQYAKSVDVHMYKAGSTARPGHGASY